MKQAMVCKTSKFHKGYLHSRIGQSTAEYAVLLAVLAAALIAMQVYVKRGLQGRIRDMANQISEKQYEQGRTNSTYYTVQTGRTIQSLDDGISQTTIPASWFDSNETQRHGEETRRWGNETVTPETVPIIPTP